MKDPPFTRLCVLIMNMLPGQGHPDVLWQLENLFAFYFLIQIVEIPIATQEAVSTVQLASEAIRVKKKPVVIFSPGNLNLGLKHTLQQYTCIKRQNMQLKTLKSYFIYAQQNQAMLVKVKYGQYSK